jgi:nucleoside-diphosphate-sugar epimerase
MNKKRVVLAGGSGFLGRALAKELLARDYEVVVLTRTPHVRSDGLGRENLR